MRTAIFVAGVLCVAVSCAVYTLASAEELREETQLWAAISVSQPVFVEGKTGRLMIHFAVVNDGETTVDPEIGSSHLLVNGRELENWDFIIANGPRAVHWEGLPPGDSVQFGYALGEHFAKPGIYRLHWEGPGFAAPEIEFRVVPKKQLPPWDARAAGMGRFEELTLEISTSDKPILPFEACPLVITLRNQTDRTVFGHHCIEPRLGMLRLYVARDGGQFYPMFLIHVPTGVMEAPREIRAGYQQACRTYLWAGQTPMPESPQQAFFPTPGEYSLKAELWSLDCESNIESNVVTIEVIEPQGEDRRAWEFLRQTTEAKQPFFFRTGEFSTKRRDDLSQFLWRFPRSRYATYARYSLGIMNLGADEIGAAAALLEQAMSAEDFPLREQLLYYLVEIYVRPRDLDKAREHLEILQQDYPNGRWARNAAQRLQSTTSD